MNVIATLVTNSAAFSAKHLVPLETSKMGNCLQGVSTVRNGIQKISAGSYMVDHQMANDNLRTRSPILAGPW